MEARATDALTEVIAILEKTSANEAKQGDSAQELLKKVQETLLRVGTDMITESLTSSAIPQSFVRCLSSVPLSFTVPLSLSLVALAMKAEGAPAAPLAKTILATQVIRPRGIPAFLVTLANAPNAPPVVVSNIATMITTTPTDQNILTTTTWITQLGAQLGAMYSLANPTLHDIAGQATKRLVDKHGEVAVEATVGAMAVRLGRPASEAVVHQTIEGIHHLLSTTAISRDIAAGLAAYLPLIFHLHAFLSTTQSALKTAAAEVLASVARSLPQTVAAQTVKRSMLSSLRDMNIHIVLGEGGGPEVRSGVDPAGGGIGVGGGGGVMAALLNVTEEGEAPRVEEQHIIDSAIKIAEILPKKVAGDLVVDLLAEFVHHQMEEELDPTAQTPTSDRMIRQMAILAGICDKIGPSVIKTSPQVSGLLTSLLQNSATVDPESLCSILSIISVMIAGDITSLNFSDVSGLIPLIEPLIRHTDEQVADIAIMVYGALQAVPMAGARDRVGSGESVDLEDVYSALKSTILPDRAYAISQIQQMISDDDRRLDINQCFEIFQAQLTMEDSYLVAAALSGICTLCDKAPTVALPCITKVISDSTQSISSRCKAAEALCQAARNMGPAVVVHATLFVGPLLDVLGTERSLVVASSLATLEHLLRSSPTMIICSNMISELLNCCNSIISHDARVIKAEHRDVHTFNRAAAAQFVYSVVEVALSRGLWGDLGCSATLVRQICKDHADDTELAVANACSSAQWRMAEFSRKQQKPAITVIK